MDDVITPPIRHRLNVDEYYRMAEAGILEWGSRVELIGGDLIDMAPIGSGHNGAVDGLARALMFACGERAIVRVQGVLRLNEWSEPQPDFAVLRPKADFYRSGHPGPADTLLVVEVSDSSLRYDRTVKLALYARAGIAEYWIVDMTRQLIDVHRQPTSDAYAETASHHAGARIALFLAPEIVVPMDTVFG